jgi:hypothetical protein
MPGSAELPTSLASMVYRQSIEVRPDPDFHNDATRLVSALRAIIDPNAPATPVPAEIKAASPGRRWLWPAAFAAAALVALALAVPALRQLHQELPPELRTEISTTAQADAALGMALSPDGRQIVFAANTAGVQRLWLRPLASTTAQPVPGTEGATFPFWSPDSRSIGFFANSSLKRLDLDAGTPMTLAPSSGQGGTWNADGVILFSQGTGKPLARVAATGGAVTEVAQPDGEITRHLFPVFLPDGRRFLFASFGSNPGTYLGSLGGGAPIRLTANYAGRGHWLGIGLGCRSCGLLGSRLARRREAADVAQPGRRRTGRPRIAGPDVFRTPDLSRRTSRGGATG